MRKPLDSNELQALLQLLDDTDTEIYRHVSDRLAGYGEVAIGLLEEAWEQSFDHVFQERVEEIIHRIQFNTLKEKLAEWKSQSTNDLMQGAMLVARYQYPDLDEGPFHKLLGQMKRHIWMELAGKTNPIEKVRVINHIIYDVYGFTGNKSNLHAIHNNYMNQVLESRKGNHLTLGILFSFLANALEVPLAGVNLPGHFILAYTESNPADDFFRMKSQREPMFYVNPFSKGAIFSKREIEQYLHQMKEELLSEYFLPAGNIQIILRLMSTLVALYRENGLSHKADEMTELAEILYDGN